MKTQIIRFLIILLILAVVIFGIMVWIGNTDMLNVKVMGKEIELSTQKGFIVAAAYTGFVLLVWTLLKAIWDLPRRLKTGVSRRKQGQALEALEDAMIAASAGDADKARKKASRARALINRPALGHIVSAQAAEVSGDPAEAEAQYTKMLENEKTRRIGQRGLANIAFARGDMSTAIEHAQTAYADNKDAKWAFDILFNAQVSGGQWNQALETLSSGERRKHISKEISRRRAAVLETAIADGLEDAGQPGALEHAIKAASDEPGFAPATALAARLYVKSGQADRAGKLIEKAWSKAPHPALSLAYRDLKTDETPKARAKRMKSLMKQNNGHRESVLLGAEEALLAGDGVAAWGALTPLANIDAPSARVCQLAAQAETLCKNPSDARLWTERCAGAPVEPDWSDLDPDGPAFDYTDADWRRLIFSYGDKGELIHPRHERFEKVRLAGLAMPVAEPEAPVPAGNASKPALGGLADDIVKAPNPDHPGAS